MTKCSSECIPARHILCFMFFSGFTVVFLLRVNLNLAIVGMVKNNATNVNSTGNFSDDTAPEEVGEFDWAEFQQSLILGAFFYGYMVSQVPGGRIAEICGTKLVFGSAVLANGLLSLLIPISARLDWILLFVIRVLQGIAQGVMYPALSASIVKWVPISERARFVSITVQGCSIGPVVAMPLCGWILSRYGWPAVFYVSGFTAVVWYVAWLFLVYDSPKVHPRISKKERKFLEDNLQPDNSPEGGMSFPWKSALLSGQFWVGVIAHIGNDYGFHIFYTFAPKYMKEALGFEIEKSALLSSLPFLCQYISATILGILADTLLTKCNVPLVVIRKASVIISHWMPGILVIVLTFCGHDVTLSVVILTLAVSMLGALTTGYYQNPIDIAPNFAGSLTGIANTLGSLAGIVCTAVAGLALQNYGKITGWHVTFYITASVYAVTSLPFLIFAQSKELSWNKPEKQPLEDVELKLMDKEKNNQIDDVKTQDIENI